MVHAAILRSPHAHARIRGIDTAAAKSAPGVLAVYTGADTDGVLNPIPCAWVVPDSDVKAVAYPAIATDIVRYTAMRWQWWSLRAATRPKTPWN